MKATLTFDLPEEQEMFETTIKAQDMWIVLTELSNKLRSMYKHEDIETIGTYECRELLFELCNEKNIEIY